MSTTELLFVLDVFPSDEIFATAFYAEFHLRFGQALRVGKDAVDFGASLVPEKVPRPVARVGVTILSAVTILSLVKTVLSTAVTIILLGILGWKAVMNDTTNSGSGGSNAGSSTDKREIDGGEEDPLEEARRIMSKYK